MPLTGPVSVTTTGDLDAADAAGTPAATDHTIAAATVLRPSHAVRMIAPLTRRSKRCRRNYLARDRDVKG